jgi:hypothetical protein
LVVVALVQTASLLSVTGRENVNVVSLVTPSKEGLKLGTTVLLFSNCTWRCL